MEPHLRETATAGSAPSARERAPETEDSRPELGPPDLPAGWRRISLPLPGAKLFHVSPPGGGAPFWLAEMTLHGEASQRRCVSELHARWWLAALVEPCAPAACIDLENRREHLRTRLLRHP